MRGAGVGPRRFQQCCRRSCVFVQLDLNKARSRALPARERKGGNVETKTHTFCSNRPLENELQPELQDARIMSPARVQEAVSRQAARVARRIVRSRETRRPVVDAGPLRVIEDVEAFRAKLEVAILGEEEALEQAHVEVRA